MKKNMMSPKIYLCGEIPISCSHPVVIYNYHDQKNTVACNCVICKRKIKMKRIELNGRYSFAIGSTSMLPRSYDIFDRIIDLICECCSHKSCIDIVDILHKIGKPLSTLGHSFVEYSNCSNSSIRIRQGIDSLETIKVILKKMQPILEEMNKPKIVTPQEKSHQLVRKIIIPVRTV